MSVVSNGKNLIRKLLKNPTGSTLVPLGIVGLGMLAAGVLAYLATSNLWLAFLAGLAGLFTVRIWWIVEKHAWDEKRKAGITADTGILVETISNLTLEVADLNLQVQSLSTKR
ncbi:MAG: hypothetical protein LBG99_07070 [Propionibacteriaceae bacterium]|jgi:hypothetical protein|nr:hypothetical protein [Propionibacteriaceae bacterium]